MANPFDRFDHPTASIRALGAPDPFKKHSADLEDKRFGLSAAELALARTREVRERDQSNSGSLPSGYRWADTSHTKQEIIPGGPADTGADSATGGVSEQATVKALVDGRMAFPTGAALRSPYWQNMLAKVAQADPNFDAINYNSRAATRRDFTSGKSAQNITAFNTALGHLGTLNDAVGELGNRSFTPWNWLANSVEKATGDPSVDKFNASAHAVVDELEKAFRGTNGTQAGIEEWKRSLNSSQSPAQAHAVISQMVDLLGSRINALGEQYKQGMGRSIDGITLLDPHAQAVFNALKPGGTGKIGKEPPNNNPLAGGSGMAPPGSGGGNDGGAASNQPGLTPGGGDRTFYTNRDQAVTDAAQKAFTAGATKEQIQAIGQQYGGYTFGPELDRAIEQRARGNVGAQFAPLPTGHEERGLSGKIADAVGSNYGSFATGVGNALTAGQLGNIAKATGGSGAGTDLAMDLSRRNAMPYMLGEMAGSILPTMGAARGLRLGADLVENPFVRAIMSNPATAEAAYGGGYGASTSDDPWRGAIIGAGMALGGNYVGSKIGSAITRFGKPSVAEYLTRGETATLNAVNKTGRDAVIDALTKASDLGVPASLADVSPEVNSLTGAAIRRSPTVAGMARDTLIPRGRGQYDRFIDAVGSYLGPIENIPQRSEDLIAGARAQAGPLYDAAYSAPGAGAAFPEIQTFLNRPSMHNALARARMIAAEEGRDPNALGFDLDANGNTTLTQVPSWQTLDYAKRGIDDVLEGYRDGTTGRLNLDEHGRAIDQTRRQFLSAVDALNPDYAAARAAYAGPAGERDALRMGQDAVNLNPDQLGMNVGNATPSQTDQMRLGFQSQLAENAGRLRYSTNPYESVLGTPAMEQRLNLLYPNGDVPRFLAQRDLEGQLAASSNRLIGNSFTASNQIADEAFAADPLIEGAVHAGTALVTHGASLPMTAMRVAGPTLRDRITFGLGKRAIAKADQIAPITLNTDPQDTIANLLAIEQKQQDYSVAKALMATTGAQRGGQVGSSVAASLIPYATAN